MEKLFDLLSSPFEIHPMSALPTALFFLSSFFITLSIFFKNFRAGLLKLSAVIIIFLCLVLAADSPNHFLNLLLVPVIPLAVIIIWGERAVFVYLMVLSNLFFMIVMLGIKHNLGALIYPLIVVAAGAVVAAVTTGLIDKKKVVI